jgi:hypothetical protein
VLDLSIVARFGLGGWNSADGFEQAPIVEPVDPFQRGELDGFQVSPRAASPDHLGLVEAVDGLGQGVVEAVADAAGSTPASASRPVYLIETYCTPRSLW